MYEIEHNLVLSTSHITKKDDDQLREEGITNSTPELCVYNYEFGYLVFVPLNIKKDDTQKRIKETYSPELVNLLLLAKRNNCTYLKLDRDGTVYDLPTFNW